MKISKNIIKAMAIKDLYLWIDNFENDGSINEYGEEEKEIYWDYIKKIQKKMIKEL